MSNKGTRKSQNAALTEEKEKRQTDSPVKEMKKKIAANAEKEKQAVDKTDKTVKSPERPDKNSEKPDKVSEKSTNEKAESKKADKNVPTPDKNAQKTDKTDKTDKHVDKIDKNVDKNDKNAEKNDKNAEKIDKNAEKNDKNAEKSDKKTDKVADKKAEKPVEKKNEAEKKVEGKGDAISKDKEKAQQNGSANGSANGVDTVSEDSSEELVIDDQDELFPELTYDETSDVDEEGAPSRSFTRRSQVKATKTPETPRPASVKEDESKEKALKTSDSLATDRKLRSADSPKPESKKPEAKKPQDSPKKDKTIDLTEDEEKPEKSEEKSDTGKNKLEMDVVIEVESMEGDARAGRTRARVSPYTRAARHDQTTSSVTANYTGNNTTMEMDITESSIVEEPALDDSSYLRGLRTIKGRSSYKPLKELSFRHTLNRSTRSTASTTSASIPEVRPTGTVVGRKRKPDAEDSIELAVEAAALEDAAEAAPEELLHAHSKRMRLFDKFSVPFRGFNTRRAAEIVGINTDLPLAAPVASSPFDPETLKPSPADPVAVPLPTPTADRETKKCIIM